jgi:hypothetical protein
MEELLDVFFGAKAHDTLDARAIVPAPVEEHDLACGGQVRHIALKIVDLHLKLFIKAVEHLGVHAALDGFGRIGIVFTHGRAGLVCSTPYS